MGGVAIRQPAKCPRWSSYFGRSLPLPLSRLAELSYGLPARTEPACDAPDVDSALLALPMIS